MSGASVWRPDGAGRFPRRTRLIAAGLAGMAALAPVLTISLGDVLVAYGMGEDARALPGTASLTSSALLPPLGETPTTASSRALAMAALRNSPVASQALVHLAIAARERGDADASISLLRIAGLTGWHDESAQRQLYNTALADNDARRAARHADALLRQGKAKPELFAQFETGVEIGAFRQALLPIFASSPVWPSEFLATHGARISDAALDDLLAARSAGAGGLERAIAAPLTAGLASSGRFAAAASAWRRVRGADGLGAGTLAWAASSAEFAAPFDWQLPEGYRAQPGAGGTLEADPAMSGEGASRLLALPPGRWKLAAADDPAVTAGWRWTVVCAGSEAFPSRLLAGDTSFAVAADCPVQRLMVASMAGAEAAAPLPALAISRAE